jgi:hypothetical protein
VGVNFAEVVLRDGARVRGVRGERHTGGIVHLAVVFLIYLEGLRVRCRG